MGINLVLSTVTMRGRVNPDLALIPPTDDAPGSAVVLARAPVINRRADATGSQVRYQLPLPLNGDLLIVAATGDPFVTPVKIDPSLVGIPFEDPNTPQLFSTSPVYINAAGAFWWQYDAHENRWDKIVGTA